MSSRRVVLVCGPPGAGKTTYARSLGLPVYDLDDGRWLAHDNPEAAFRYAIAQLARNPRAQAVVIRSGARRSSRARWQALIGATTTHLLAVPLEECRARILERNRPRPPIPQQLAALHAWWAEYQPDTLPYSRDWTPNVRAIR